MRGAQVVFASLALVAACSGYDKDQRVDPGVGQSGTDFYPVALMLVDKCGQIDCHGSKYRNMRLYGFSSERINPLDKPGSPETTQAESDEDYASVVALEPTILQQVIAAGGANPERLTFYRKARGTEMHKGNAQVAAGDNADRCILSWLQSKTDAAACRLAIPRLNMP